jgi:Flavin-binding monooxygenase-like/Family of unknown function (DUF6314)
VILDNAKEIKDVDALLFCTGYKPSFPFFSPEILSLLQFSPSDTFHPLLLHRCIFHPSLPNLGFVGMYRGPYFGIQELQARFVASVFYGARAAPSTQEQLAGIEREARIRNAVPRPQFPHGDYVGLATALAREIGAAPPEAWRAAHDVLVPAHFRLGNADAEREVRTVEEECEAYTSGKRIAAVVFRALEGEWKLERKLEDRKGVATGMVKGTAVFSGIPSSDPREYLYHETGVYSSVILYFYYFIIYYSIFTFYLILRFIYFIFYILYFIFNVQ